MHKKIPRRLRYGKKIPRRLRFVLSSGTMFPWWRRRRRRLHLMMATFIYFMMPTFIYRCVHPNSSWWRRSSIGAFILTPPDDDVHLSVRSSCLLMTTFICRCVHLSPDDDVPLTIDHVPIGDRHFERVVPINGYIWTEASNGSPSFVCCCRCCGFAVGSLCLRRFCFLVGLFLATPGALLLLLMFFERGFQEDSLRKLKT